MGSNGTLTELQRNSTNWTIVVDEIVKMEKKIFPKHESLARSFDEDLKKKNSGLLYIQIHGQVVGYVMYAWPTSLSASITKLAGPISLSPLLKFPLHARNLNRLIKVLKEILWNTFETDLKFFHHCSRATNLNGTVHFGFCKLNSDYMIAAFDLAKDKFKFLALSEIIVCGLRSPGDKTRTRDTPGSSPDRTCKSRVLSGSGFQFLESGPVPGCTKPGPDPGFCQAYWGVGLANFVRRTRNSATLCEGLPCAKNRPRAKPRPKITARRPGRQNHPAEKGHKNGWAIALGGGAGQLRPPDSECRETLRGPSVSQK
ncbi:hypothetical protein WN944_005644 [Citrus x changshan-huyou]|uniref:Uncharacterized protein n=1 Tax=Citrus x changshan-huyou TaxID=2935761 RepID=A0AAP0LSZ5_9ROSI